MLRICRAEDGHLFQTNATLRDIERAGSLELFIHQETGLNQDAVLAYLSDGRRLTNSNVRDLAGAADQTIFVFNKFYLDYELEDVLKDLHVQPALQPVVEESIPATPPFRPSQLAASYLRTARLHHEQVNQTLIALQYQHEALRIATSSLDLHVLAIFDTFESIAANSKRELTKQASLLEGLDADLELVSRVKIHVEFMSNSVRRAIEAGERHRTLGDYVSNDKMRTVAAGCLRTHEDLKARFDMTEQAVLKLKEGTDIVRSSVSDRRLLDDAEACFRQSQALVERITDYAAALEGPTGNTDNLIHELRDLDHDHRNGVHFIATIKNEYTEQCIIAVRRISVLNNDVVQIPPALTALQASFRGKNSFSHIQRLHNMLFAYGATVIEIVRRKEFSRFFFQRAQTILEVMAKLSAGERKRRQVYRSEVHGQLPFDTRGMDDAVPTIDFSPTGHTDAAYSLERADVDALMRVLDDLERYSQSSNDEAALRVVSECRVSLQKLIVKMDGLEIGFDRIAERSLLSASRLSSSRRRSIEAEEQAYQELAEQLRVTQEAKAHQEALFQEERRSLQSEIWGLKKGLEKADFTSSTEQERSNRLERELHQVRAQLEGDTTARRILEGRNTDLAADIESQRVALERALADATDQSREAELVRQELAQVKAEFEEVKALEAKNANKVVALLEEQANNLRKLEDARSRGEDLQAQIRAARAESDEVHQALKEASSEKDRLLRAQASEHDRIIRDHRAEADGDRAVLERQFFELKAIVGDRDRTIKDLRAEVEVANADAVGLREELQRVEHDLREARHMERILRDDLRTGQVSQSGFEQRLEDSSRLVAQILNVAITFRDSHVKAMASAQTMTSHTTSGRYATATHALNMAESALSSGMRHSIIGHGHNEEAEPIDPSDPATALEILRGFDHDHFLEAISKSGSTIRKWQKQCKEYRERAKGKISFRNFAKGDLALFLPTRNSVSKPWAAFNVSFPHYFLQATGHLAEQLKTREWIVARITSITERVVDHQDPTSNPYGLGDGVKYYMLEVEDWTQPSQNKRRASSRKVSVDKTSKDGLPAITPINSPPSLPPVIASGPPETEVEETFRVTHPPNSQFFPVRARSNSSPGARPSSLSRLLAQATENQIDALSSHHSGHQHDDEVTPHEIPHETSSSPRDTPSPPLRISQSPAQASPLPPPSPSLPPIISSVPQNFASQSSPLRPGSRASRLSTTSKFSGRIPTLGSSPGAAKAPPTTALTDQTLLSSSPSNDGNPFGSPVTPSPEGSVSDGPNGLLNRNRRRTTSYNIPRSSPLAASSSQPSALPPARPVLTAANTLANLASNWGVTFGRRKKIDVGSLAPTVESPPPEEARDMGSSDRVRSDTPARDLLKRL
ncbi:putative peripheral membrane protein [Macrolepiota fuliginosa MF-IS2]|uniref:Autophagy-related protein 11 n=1 Tax=Macrolepiota fuliginosa MF-IS2 TaxID=1400762 RepID=A0A9P5X3G5_9AGAR|nr:putative peripheral membrane protein [Macrolepiota fuliginosa MF-IS2]